MIAIASSKKPTQQQQLQQTNPNPGHLILTSPKNNQVNQLLFNSNKNEINSLPLSKERTTAQQLMTNSQSFDNGFNERKTNDTKYTTIGSNCANKETSPSCTTTTTTTTTTNTQNKSMFNPHTPVAQTGPKLALNNFNKTNLNSPKSRSTTTPNLQKYHSFQKPSFSLSEIRCNFFNMPFICQSCSTRN